jgi:thiamine pyrophosphate-dependent acetolactate synthase large subunit-like protein
LPLLRAFGKDIILTRAEQIAGCMALFFGVYTGEARQRRRVCF